MANTFLHANHCEVTQHQAVKDSHSLVGWCKCIKGYLRCMCKRRIQILVEGFSISTPKELCRPPYVTLAGIELDLVLWQK